MVFEHRRYVLTSSGEQKIKESSSAGLSKTDKTPKEWITMCLLHTPRPVLLVSRL